MCIIIASNSGFSGSDLALPQGEEEIAIICGWFFKALIQAQGTHGSRAATTRPRTAAARSSPSVLHHVPAPPNTGNAPQSHVPRQLRGQLARRKVVFENQTQNQTTGRKQKDFPAGRCTVRKHQPGLPRGDEVFCAQNQPPWKSQGTATSFIRAETRLFLCPQHSDVLPWEQGTRCYRNTWIIT